MQVLLLDYLHGKENPAAYLRTELNKANPDASVSRENARYWYQAARAGEKVVIRLNKGKPFWLGREATYWSAE